MPERVRLNTSTPNGTRVNINGRTFEVKNGCLEIDADLVSILLPGGSRFSKDYGVWIGEKAEEIPLKVEEPVKEEPEDLPIELELKEEFE